MSQLSTTAFDNEEVAELARDVDDQLRALAERRKVTMTAQYQLPLYLSLDGEPFAISAVRIRQRDNPAWTARQLRVEREPPRGAHRRD
jgi:hypothetical protein